MGVIDEDFVSVSDVSDGFDKDFVLVCVEYAVGGEMIPRGRARDVSVVCH